MNAENVRYTRLASEERSSQVYNDGYRVIVGEKHAEGMGMGCKECWESAGHRSLFQRAWAGETSLIRALRGNVAEQALDLAFVLSLSADGTEARLVSWT